MRPAEQAIHLCAVSGLGFRLRTEDASHWTCDPGDPGALRWAWKAVLQWLRNRVPAVV